jgi:hypothetical protein
VILKGRIFFFFLLFLAFCFGFRPAFSQSQSQFRKDGDESKTVRRKGQNLVGYDSKRLHYGFFLALNRSSFKTLASPFFNNQLVDPNLDSASRLFSINPQPAVGFTTGFIFNLRLFNLLDARILPSVSFYQRSLVFRFQNDSSTTELNQSTFSFMELPILLKFKSVRRNNTRMYILGGIKPGFEVGSKMKELQQDRLRATSFDFNVEYGFGFDFYYPLFKFSPEIRFSHGFSNLKNTDPNVYAQSISRMYTHTVTLYFNFE